MCNTIFWFGGWYNKHASYKSKWPHLELAVVTIQGAHIIMSLHLLTIIIRGYECYHLLGYSAVWPTWILARLVFDPEDDDTFL
jgi:hypothetical protein